MTPLLVELLEKFGSTITENGWYDMSKKNFKGENFMFKRARILAVIFSAFVLLVGGSMFTINAASNDQVKKGSKQTTTYYVKSDEAFAKLYKQLLQQWDNKNEVNKVPSKNKHNYHGKHHGKWNHQNGKDNVVDEPKKEPEVEKKPEVENKPQVEEPKQPVQKPQPTEPVVPEQPTQPVPENNNNSNGSQQGELNAFEWQVFELTNKERVNNGLQPLQVDYELSRVAHEKSRDMATNYYFSHDSPVYGSPFDMMRSYGITYRTAGENIAKGQRTPAEVVQAWMNSPGHRANILNPNFTHIGLGYVEQGNHWTQQFIGK